MHGLVFLLLSLFHVTVSSRECPTSKLDMSNSKAHVQWKWAIWTIWFWPWKVCPTPSSFTLQSLAWRSSPSRCVNRIFAYFFIFYFISRIISFFFKSFFFTFFSIQHAIPGFSLDWTQPLDGSLWLYIPVDFNTQAPVLSVVSRGIVKPWGSDNRSLISTSWVRSSNLKPDVRLRALQTYVSSPEPLWPQSLHISR